MSNLKLIQLNSLKEKIEKEGKVKVMKIENPIGIIVRKDGTAEEIFIDKKLDVDNIDWKPFKQYIKTKGRGDIERECDWEMPDGMLVSMFGWVKGKEENINKLEVPPPVDMELYYGDLIFIATIKGFPICFNIEKFEEFYSEAFGGFEDIEDSDEEANDEYDEEGDDDSFIVEDHESEPEDSEESEEEAGETETESEEETETENEHSESEQNESEAGETNSENSELEYRSLTEEEQNSDEVKILENEIEKITEEQIIENCLGELFIGFANDELCILSGTEDEERYGEEIEINGNKIVLVPLEEE
jgi:hypothetical protein